MCSRKWVKPWYSIGSSELPIFTSSEAEDLSVAGSEISNTSSLFFKVIDLYSLSSFGLLIISELGAF